LSGRVERTSRQVRPIHTARVRFTVALSRKQWVLNCGLWLWGHVQLGDQELATARNAWRSS
jgi:hypothetical protein